MRKTLRASVLVLALCCPAFAGDIPNPVYAPTPQPKASTVQEPAAGEDVETLATAPTTEGEIQNGAAAATFVEVVLNLLALL
jgi:hypothetical protein